MYQSKATRGKEYLKAVALWIHNEQTLTVDSLAYQHHVDLGFFF